MEDKVIEIIDDLCLGKSIDDIEDIFIKDSRVSWFRYGDENIDDGITEEDAEDMYVMCRYYDMIVEGVSVCVDFYFGDYTRTVEHIDYDF